MLKVLSNILCDLESKVKVIGQKAGICDGVPSTSALVILLLSSADFFSKLPFSKKSFWNTIRVSNGLDPDQDQQNGPTFCWS